MWSQRVSDLLAEYVLIDLVRHLQQQRMFRDLKTCPQFRQETVLRSRCDYIIGTYWRRFDLVGIRDMRNYTLDHFAIRARLLRHPTCYHTQYLRGRRALTLRIPTTVELSKEDANFQTLKTLEPVSPKLKCPPRPLCMSPNYIRFIDKRVALQRKPQHSCNVERGLTRSV